MAELKGLNELNRKMTEALSAFNVRAEAGDDFAYYWEQELVTFPVVAYNSNGDIFLEEFIKDRFGFVHIDHFVALLLHEVGHHLANEETDEGAVADFCWEEKERIEQELKECAEDDYEAKKRLHYQYYNLPEELMATQWAANYIKENPLAVNKLICACESALYEFYEKNEVWG